MKLYAQHGAQAGEKVEKGSEIVDRWVIYSPRDISAENLRNKFKNFRNNFQA